MIDDKVLSVVEKETAYQKTVTTKTEHECYCHGIWGLPKEIRTKVTHQNCPCQEKYDKFLDKTELNKHAAEREFLKQENFGPCLKCKGTGRAVRTNVQKNSKYLCVNGPQIGLKFTTIDMPNVDPNYTLYNCGSRSEPQFKCVWVWDKSLVDMDK